jgi:hypothetical protein
MARPTAAAALAACAAVLLLFAGQSVAILFPFGAFFPVDYVPPTVRIFISDKLSLNVAVYDHGDNTQVKGRLLSHLLIDHVRSLLVIDLASCTLSLATMVCFFFSQACQLDTCFIKQKRSVEGYNNVPY